MTGIFVIVFVGDATTITKRDGTQSYKQSVTLRGLGGKWEDTFVATYFGGNSIMDLASGTVVAAALRCSVRTHEGQDYQDITLQEYTLLSSNTPRWDAAIPASVPARSTSIPVIPPMPQLV